MSKKALREELKKARLELSVQRREEAALSLFISLLPSLAYYASVLSFAALPLEINTSLLNRFLANTGKLLLPKTVGDTLKIFRVTNLTTQLVNGPLGLSEPDPAICEEVSSECIEIALVPALGFDQANNRIGYGKGYYDRFLGSIDCPAIGIGYKEQLIESLPIEPTDFPLSDIRLF